MADLHSIEGGRKKPECERELEICDCGCPWFKQEMSREQPDLRIQTCMMCCAEYTVSQVPESFT